MFKLPDFFGNRPEPELLAAVDLGSNSFHLIVVRIAQGQVIVLDRLREMVRLAAGLDAKKYLSFDAQQRALDCLARFGQRLRDMPSENVRIVGTNTLRAAVNADEFLIAAEKVIRHPIEIIAGREEARLIYLGVAHTLPTAHEKRLVIDIGGGSTEFIIGRDFDSLCRESLSMGCVNISRRYFDDGAIKAKAMRRAEIAALSKLQPIENLFRQTGWDKVVGASGTLRAVERIIRQMGWGDDITPAGLQQLRQALLDAGHVEALNIKGLTALRAPVFPGGLAVLLGIFEGLGIQHMSVSDGALREGLIYDLLGRIGHEDVRERTIQSLTARYQIDTAQAERVENTALLCLSQVAVAWQLVNTEYANMLSWAARLHEIGLSVAHDQYHKHGAYLLTHSDLAGFSNSEQTLLATLVRVHQRRFSQEVCQRCPQIAYPKLVRLCLLLRLAVLLHRSRSSSTLPSLTLYPKQNGLTVCFPTDWLEQHPLTQADLEQERDYLQAVDIQLHFE